MTDDEYSEEEQDLRDIAVTDLKSAEYARIVLQAEYDYTEADIRAIPSVEDD
jgi:hypothetical protein